MLVPSSGYIYIYVPLRSVGPVAMEVFRIRLPWVLPCNGAMPFNSWNIQVRVKNDGVVGCLLWLLVVGCGLLLLLWWWWLLLLLLWLWLLVVGYYQQTPLKIGRASRKGYNEFQPSNPSSTRISVSGKGNYINLGIFLPYQFGSIFCLMFVFFLRKTARFCWLKKSILLSETTRR